MEDVSANGFHEKVSGGRLQWSGWKDFRTNKKNMIRGFKGQNYFQSIP